MQCITHTGIGLLYFLLYVEVYTLVSKSSNSSAVNIFKCSTTEAILSIVTILANTGSK